MSGIFEDLRKMFSNLTGNNNRQPGPNNNNKIKVVPWGAEAFPENGAPVIIEIDAGQTVRFRSIDDELHNVAEAMIVENDDDEFCWVPDPKPRLGLNFKTRSNFDETITFNKGGTYYLVSPVKGQHEVMRLVVNVNPSDSEATQRASEAAGRIQQAQNDVMRAEAQAKQKAQEAKQKAQEAVRNGNNATQNVAQQAQAEADQARRIADEARERAENIIGDIQEELEDLGEETVRIVQNLIGRQKFKSPLGIFDDLNVLEGTGTYSTVLPGPNMVSFDISSLFNPNKPIGPLGPVVRRNGNANGNSNSNTNGNTNGNANADSNGNTNGNGNGNANGNGNSNANANGNGNTNGNDEDCGCEDDNPVYYFRNEKPKKKHRHKKRKVRYDKDEQKLTIPWNLENFENRQGQPRMINVPVKTVLHFQSVDDLEHSVVEATSDFEPDEDPLVDTRDEVRANFNEMVALNQTGTYYFVDAEYPEDMRLVVQVIPVSEDVSNIIDGV